MLSKTSALDGGVYGIYYIHISQNSRDNSQNQKQDKINILMVQMVFGISEIYTGCPFSALLFYHIFMLMMCQKIIGPL